MDWSFSIILPFSIKARLLLENAGIEFTCKPPYSEAPQIKSLMFMGPEGYLFEVEEFLAPADRKAFYGEEMLK